MIATKHSLSALGLACVFTVAGIGCRSTPEAGPMSDGQKMERRAQVLKDKANMTQRGERLVADGNALIAKGRSMSEQGQTIDGQKSIIDGEAKVREGSLYIRQANDIALPDAPMTVEPIAPMDSTTRPSTMRSTADRPM